MPENEFDEFFKKILGGFAQQPSDEQVQEEMTHAAKIAFMLHTSYLKAGFTVDQAFELTKLQLNAAADTKGKR